MTTIDVEKFVSAFQSAFTSALREALIAAGAPEQLTLIESPKKKKPKPEETPGFKKFWAPYPRKVGKAAALAEWPGDELADAIYGGLMKQLPGMRRQMRIDEHMVPHARTWLKQRRWEDETETKPAAAGGYEVL